MRDIYTTEPGGNVFDESPAFDGETKRKAREYEPTPNNLTLYRWRDPILGPDEERDLIRWAQAGDARAKNVLTTRFHRAVLKIAAEFSGPSRDDLVAAGMIGLADAIARFDLRRNTRLSAFAIALIRYSVSKEVKEWRRRAQSGETRADRWVYSHRDATPEQVVAKVGCSLKDAKEALQRAENYWHGHDDYDTAERGHDEDDEDARRSVVAADVPTVEVHPTGGIVTNDDWAAIVICRERSALKPIGRARYQVGQAEAHRIGVAQASLAKHIERQLLVHLDRPKSRIERESLFRYGLQRLADEIDRRELRRLKAMGRRAYAQELIEKDRRRIEARANPENYLYPRCRRETTQQPRSKSRVASVAANRSVRKFEFGGALTYWQRLNGERNETVT